MPKSKHKIECPIHVIDLFAGSGGLSEGYSAFKPYRGLHPFEVTLSVEMEEYAHRTLMLRSFYRQFCERRVPDLTTVTLGGSQG